MFLSIDELTSERRLTARHFRPSPAGRCPGDPPQLEKKVIKGYRVWLRKDAAGTGRGVHELTLTQNMLGLIEDSARRGGFSRVRTVWLEIGCLAPVEPEALRFCFDAVTRGSCAEGARLEIESAPGHAKCLRCGAESAIETIMAVCPACGGHPLQVSGGRDMRVRRLEVE